MDPLLPVLSLTAPPTVVVDPTGRIVYVTATGMKHRECPAKVIQHLIRLDDGRIVAMPSLESREPAGTTEFKTMRLLPELPPGSYRYMSYLEYACNPVQTIWPLRKDLPYVDFVRTQEHVLNLAPQPKTPANTGKVVLPTGKK